MKYKLSYPDRKKRISEYNRQYYQKNKKFIRLRQNIRAGKIYNIKKVGSLKILKKKKLVKDGSKVLCNFCDWPFTVGYIYRHMKYHCYNNKVINNDIVYAKTKKKVIKKVTKKVIKKKVEPKKRDVKIDMHSFILKLY
jgi:hypothetical protein